jgi:hypothetical protein
VWHLLLLLHGTFSADKLTCQLQWNDSHKVVISGAASQQNAFHMYSLQEHTGLHCDTSCCSLRFPSYMMQKGLTHSQHNLHPHTTFSAPSKAGEQSPILRQHVHTRLLIC